MFYGSSPVTFARYAGRSSLHTSSVIAARPKYGVGKGMKFVPARARLADNPNPDAPRRPWKRPLAPRANNAPESRHSQTTHDNTAEPVTTKNYRAPKRERIMDLPSDSRETPAHLSAPTSSFTSPPLLPGLVDQIRILLGPRAKPTPVQALSLAHFFRKYDVAPSRNGTLLAAETGSGKSLAYLLPLVQSLKKKEAELRDPVNHELLDMLDNLLADSAPTTAKTKPEPPESQFDPPPASPTFKDPLDSIQRPIVPELRLEPNKPAPRALILVPTHELARQIKSTLSHLTHARDTKLRSVCLSHASGGILSNRVSYPKRALLSPIKEVGSADDPISGGSWQGLDVVIVTPSMLLDFVRPEGRHSVGPKRPGDEPVKKKIEKEVRMSLEKVKWVVVDEADVLFDPDFSSWTEAVLQDIKKASSEPPNLILATATVSARLSTYLSTHYPFLAYLTTPNLHRLPASLQTEYVHWDRRPGNRFPTILRKMQDLWADEERAHPGWKEKSKIVVFCNRSSKVEELGAFLEDKGVKCVKLTSSSEARARGSNRHIQAFLKPLPRIKRYEPLGDGASPSVVEETAAPEETNQDDEPRVLITTSLLSRGLDFSPLVTSVFIVDEPRNEVDYIHRAGRTGRAGHPGKVVVFTKGQDGRERTVKGTRRVWGFDAA
ncbi:DEAD/DEAH box helicase [Ceratobasidium sp. AG-Ba]|nr:DEAD/DEAH box helicase [Ceratobasidium sp. AG-Ba]